ncbi:MAG: hypothetical protein IK055_10895 [Lachnospiraceae bacterium]|nr:hypothetical protein [Lachnospiraceae bacterium]
MKKLLATVLAVVLAMTMILGTALADETEIATSNATITDAVTNAPEGSKIVVTVKYDPKDEGGTADGTAGAGWGIGGICTDGSWTVDGAFEAKTSAEPAFGDVLTFEFNVDDIKKAAAGDINLNFYNGFAVQKAVLSTPAGAGDGKADGKGGDAPKTADTMTVVLFAGVAILALGAVVASKKARA